MQERIILNLWLFAHSLNFEKFDNRFTLSVLFSLNAYIIISLLDYNLNVYYVNYLTSDYQPYTYKNFIFHIWFHWRWKFVSDGQCNFSETLANLLSVRVSVKHVFDFWKNCSAQQKSPLPPKHPPTLIFFKKNLGSTHY